jgi:DNA-binding transcriptional MocR family regulator
MRYLDDTAAYVLRYMAEHGILGRNFMQREKLAKVCGLTEERFIQAEEDLLQAGYITGTKGGMYGTMWLSSIGIAAYQSIKNDYLPIDTDAQHILTYLVAHLNEKNLVPVREIFEATGIPLNTFEDSIQQLKDRGLIEDITGGFRALKPTIAGRLAEKNGFRKEGAHGSPILSAAVPPGPVEAIMHSGNTGPLPRADNLTSRADYPTVQVDKEPTEENELKGELIKIVDKLVNDMFPRLGNENKKQYLDIAVQFQQEIRKPAPDTRILRYLLSGLTFTSDMGGTFDPGDKVFQLVIDAEPTIVTIASLLRKILEPNPR